MLITTTNLLSIAAAATLTGTPPDSAGVTRGLPDDYQHALAYTWGTDDPSPVQPSITIGDSTYYGTTYKMPEYLSMGRYQRHEVTVEGLEPNTSYDLVLNPGEIEVLSVTTWQHSIDPTVLFTFTADIGTKNRSRDIAESARNFKWPWGWVLGAQGWKTADKLFGVFRDFALLPGDLGYANFDDMTSVGGRPGVVGKENPWDWDYTHKLFMHHQYDMKSPVIPILGNHEQENYQSNYQWGTEGPALRWVVPNNENWFSFKKGAVGFIAIDSNLSNTSDQKAWDQMYWLYDTLKEFSTDSYIKWIIVSQHHPIFGAGGAPPIFSFIEESMFNEFGVDVLIVGHRHSQEQWEPRKDGLFVSVEDPHIVPRYAGFVQIVQGGGGRGLQDSPIQEDGISWSALQHGFCVARVTPKKLEIVWLNVNGYPHNWTRIQ